MKIKYVTIKFDQEGGGSNRSLELIASHFNEEHDVEIVTLNSQKNSINQTDVPIKKFSCENWPNILRTCFNVFNDLESDTDIFHVFSPELLPIGGLYRKSGGQTPVIGRLNRYNLFCTNPSKIESDCFKQCSLKNKIDHDIGDNLDKVKRTPEYIYKHISLPVASHIDLALAISPTIKKIYTRAGLSCPVKVVPNFYDPSFPTNSNDGSKTTDQLLYVGRLVEEKDVSTLLYSFQQLNQSCELLIVGEGPCKSKLKNIASRSQKADEIKFKGWVPYEQLSNIYASSSIFIHPGRWPEPFGRTIIEAMQHELPLVVSNIGAPPWIAKDAAVTFEPESEEDLAKSIETLLSPSQMSKKSENCKEQLRRFSPQNITTQIRKEYENVIKMPLVD